MPPLINSFQWIAGHAIAGLVGVVLGFLLQGALPPSFRTELIYWGGRLRKWWRNDTYDIGFTVQYALDEPAEREDFIERLSRILPSRPDDNGHFRYKKSENETEKVDIEVTPQYVQKQDVHGGRETDVDVVSAVVVEYEATPSYRELTPALLDVQESEKEILEALASNGAVRESSAIVCEMPAKPTLQRLLGDTEVETVRATSNSGARVDVTQDEIQIHSPPSGSVTPILRKAIVHYA